MARPSDHTASPAADKHVSSMIRARRRARGLSMAELGAMMGLSYQQIQKYENGSNRVSVARLIQFASSLEVAPDWFFEGLPPTIPVAFAVTGRFQRQAVDVAADFATIEEPELRATLLMIVRRAARDAE